MRLKWDIYILWGNYWVGDINIKRFGKCAQHLQSANGNIITEDAKEISVPYAISEIW